MISLIGAAALLVFPCSQLRIPHAAAPTPPAKATCKHKVVGKGLDRHSVCEIDAEVTVTASNKPSVVVVPRDPRNVVGRPRSGDRLDGLSHQLHQ